MHELLHHICQYPEMQRNPRRSQYFYRRSQLLCRKLKTTPVTFYTQLHLSKPMYVMFHCDRRTFLYMRYCITSASTQKCKETLADRSISTADRNFFVKKLGKSQSFSTLSYTFPSLCSPCSTAIGGHFFARATTSHLLVPRNAKKPSPIAVFLPPIATSLSES